MSARRPVGVFAQKCALLTGTLEKIHALPLRNSLCPYQRCMTMLGNPKQTDLLTMAHAGMSFLKLDALFGASLQGNQTATTTHRPSSGSGTRFGRAHVTLIGQEPLGKCSSRVANFGVGKGLRQLCFGKMVRLGNIAASDINS